MRSSFFCFIFLLSSSVWAVPAAPTLFEITQPDKSKIQAVLKGDEWFNWTETVNQRVIVKNSKTGFYEYAVIKKEGELEVLVPSGVIVKKKEAKESFILQELKTVTRKDLRRLWQAAVKRNNRFFIK